MAGITLEVTDTTWIRMVSAISDGRPLEETNIIL